MREFPHTIPPTGWYRVAWSAEVPTLGLQRTEYFGSEQVVFRDADGCVRMLDAYCPHMGAHLGYGGTHRAGVIECPFHGWKWAPTGENIEVPDASKPSPKCIPAWEVREISGLVMAWFSGDGKPPSWEPEELPEALVGTHLPIYPHAFQLWEGEPVHPQALVENIADPVHVQFVHRSKGVPEVLFEYSGHRFDATYEYQFGAGRAGTWLNPDGPVEVSLLTQAFGLGYTISRYKGLHEAVHLLGSTPIRPGVTDMWAAALLPDDGTRPGLSAFNSRLVSELFKSHEQDLPIWRHMRYVESPPYSKSEAKAHGALREWSSQFYVSEGDVH